MDEAKRLRKRARVLSVVVAVAWAVLVAGFGGLTVALQFAESADDDRAVGMVQFMTGSAAVVAIGPALLWLVVTSAYRRGRQWAGPVGVAVAAVTGMCSVLLLPLAVFADWGGFLDAFMLLLNGLGVAAAAAMLDTRNPMPTPSVPRSG